jgi:hypothetical protein
MARPSPATTDRAAGIPAPVVAANRATIVVTVLVALLTGLPVLTTVLLAVLVAAVSLGPRGSVIALVTTRLLPAPVGLARERGDIEDATLMRFNNVIAVALLALAQVAFLTGWPVAGWVLAVVVAVAATVALAGFCVGCHVFTGWRLWRYRVTAGGA